LQSHNTSLVFDLIKNLDEERPIQFGEFVSAFWQLDQQDQIPEKADPRGSLNVRASMERDKQSVQKSLKEPSITNYNVNSERMQVLLKEYGAMHPSKDVFCVPDLKTTKFLR
jgi:hypothetical protein